MQSILLTTYQSRDNHSVYATGYQHVLLGVPPPVLGVPRPYPTAG